MNERCPHCDLRFERESGYFIGAMYFAYALSLPTGGLMFFAIWYFTQWSMYRTLALMFVIYLPMVPFIFRLSRVLWLHWDRSIDP